MQTTLLILLGMAAGVASGLVGIGGGVILVPALVFCSASPNIRRRALRWP